MKIRSQGFTLIELMTALAVLGILVAIAVPTFRQFSIESRTAAATNDLVTALTLARSEALRRSGSAAACASTDLLTCSGSNNWATGWVVFADPNGNSTLDAGEMLLQSWPALDAGFTMTATGVTSGNGVSSVGYNTMGMGNSTETSRFRIAVTGCAGNRVSQTDVLMTGMPQNRKVACP